MAHTQQVAETLGVKCSDVILSTEGPLSPRSTTKGLWDAVVQAAGRAWSESVGPLQAGLPWPFRSHSWDALLTLASPDL